MARQRPTVVVFDVNETLSDLSPMADHFAEIGLPRHLVRTWFAALLRDGFAATAAGHSEPFGVLADHALRALLAESGVDTDPDSAVRQVLDGFSRLPVHADVRAGINALAHSGAQLITLSNGATTVADGVLTRAGLRDRFSRLLSVDAAGAWKPTPVAYEYAAGVCGTELGQMMLVAAHPWDIDGAACAGMRTAWINRTGATYPDYFMAPEITARGIDHLAEQLVV